MATFVLGYLTRSAPWLACMLAVILLGWLTAQFIEHNNDMKWLHRQIASSRAYQRSWKPNDTNREDRRNFSRAIPRRLPAEVVYDSVKQAVAQRSGACHPRRCGRPIG